MIRYATAMYLPFLLLLGLLSNIMAQENNRPFNAYNLQNIKIDFSVTAARPLSMGGAAIALSDDAAATALNPAGTASFNRPAYSFSTRIRRDSQEYGSFNCATIGATENNDNFFLDQVFLNVILPSKNIRLASYRETLVDDRISYRALRPFMVDPNDDFAENLRKNFPSQETLLRMRIVDNTGVLAWRFTDRLNFGTTVRLTRFEYHLTEDNYFEHDLDQRNDPFCVQNVIEDDNLYLARRVDESKWGLGYSLGFLGKISSRLNLGLVYNYRPAFSMRFKNILPGFEYRQGTDSVKLPAGQALRSLDRLKYNIPNSLGIGLAYRYPGWLNIAIDFVRVEYSELLNLQVEGFERDFRNLIQDDGNNQGIDPSGPDLVVDDRWEIRAGLEYILKLPANKGRLPLRFGYYLEPTHQIYTRDTAQLLRAEFPKGEDKHHFTGGFGLFFGERVRFDSAINMTGSNMEIMITSVYTFL